MVFIHVSPLIKLQEYVRLSFKWFHTFLLNKFFTAVDSELMIENIAPMAPYNVTANSTSTTITLRWVPGYIRTYLKYLIWYRPSNSQEWRSAEAE